MIYRDEILANRLKWINYLKEPERQKTEGCLEDSKNPEARCCLGHACAVFNRHKTIDDGGSVRYDDNTSVLNHDFAEYVLGLWDNVGRLASGLIVIEGYESHSSLANLNDKTSITPQEIGTYLESVIEGGENTPFRPLNYFEERTL